LVAVLGAGVASEVFVSDFDSLELSVFVSDAFDSPAPFSVFAAGAGAELLA
jgi:hypothetical protein